jgi:hypothetical protein
MLLHKSLHAGEPAGSPWPKRSYHCYCRPSSSLFDQRFRKPRSARQGRHLRNSQATASVLQELRIQNSELRTQNTGICENRVQPPSYYRAARVSKRSFGELYNCLRGVWGREQVERSLRIQRGSSSRLTSPFGDAAVAGTWGAWGGTQPSRWTGGERARPPGSVAAHLAMGSDHGQV